MNKTNQIKRAQKQSPTEEKTGATGKFERAQAFTQLGLRFAETKDVYAIGDVLYDFCNDTWEFDCFLFTAKRSESNYEFESITAYDTYDGVRINTSTADNRSDYTPKATELIEGHPLLINRPANATESPYTTFGLRDRVSSSLIFAPVMVKGVIIGVISVQSYTPDIFDEQDRDFLVKIANTVGPTLQRCRAEQRTREFLKLAERLNQVVEPIGVARVVANTAANLLGWNFMSLHLRSTISGHMQLVTGLSRSSDECVIYSVADHKQDEIDDLLETVLADGVGALYEHSQGPIGPFGRTLPFFANVILTPVKSQNRVIGLLCFQTQQTGAYGTEELEIARGLSDNCGSALERSWFEQNLTRSEENYRMLLENINDGVVISQDDRFIFFNARFAEMLGYQADELGSKSYTDIYTARGVEILLGRAAKRAAGEVVPDRYETFFTKSDGSLLPVEANVRIIENYQGKKATFAVIRDISERKVSEEKQRKADEELRALFQAMTDIILVIDKDGKYLSHGSKQNQFLFTPGQQLADKTLHEIFSKEKADYLLHHIRQVLASGETITIEYDRDIPNAEAVWYNATITPLSKHTVLMVARDITERRIAEDELFRSNAHYRALLDGSEDYIFVLDRDLRFIHVNSTIEKRYQVNRNDRLGSKVDDIFRGREEPHYINLIRSVFKTGVAITYDDDAVIDGRLICTETVVSPVQTRSGEVDTVLGISRDVTERRQAELALKHSERRYAAAVRGANDGIWDWNLQTNELYLSPRWWAIVGESEQERSSTPDEWLNRVHPTDLVSLQEKIHDHINGNSPHLEDEHRILHSNGSYRWVLCRGVCVRDAENQTLQMAGSLSDITDRKEAEYRLHYGANHDALTNLPNRARFLDFLEKAMARSRRMDTGSYHFAVLFLDMDRFKIVNDSLGHLAGDQVIVAMARRLENCVRPGDTVARMGGDEFTILLEDLNHETDATRVAERVIRELSAPVKADGVSVQMTVSVGIAFGKPDYQNQNDLLRDADTAMYRAKAAGRNRYQVFDQQMHENAMKQLHWEADLRKAVARQEFELYYQPVYKLSEARLSGFEGLIRWNHPTRGLIFPGDFIAMAEDTGLIVPLGWWVIDQAARAVAIWNKDRDPDKVLTVSVNMSPRQIAQPGVVSRLRFLVANAGALPEHIIIEITENLLMENSEAVSDTLQGLRDPGFKLDLDDFGTGYSSLSYLSSYPLDMLKIDRSFVSNLDTKDSSRQIINAMLTLARGLDLLVTAEGVETPAQCDALLQLGCDYAQGYYFGKPKPFDDAVRTIAERWKLPHNCAGI